MNGLKKQRKGACSNELLQKEGPLSVTLHEFFPKSFYRGPNDNHLHGILP